MSQIASHLRFAIRITNRSRSQIARFGALRCPSIIHVQSLAMRRPLEADGFKYSKAAPNLDPISHSDSNPVSHNLAEKSSYSDASNGNRNREAQNADLPFLVFLRAKVKEMRITDR